MSAGLLAGKSGAPAFEWGFCRHRDRRDRHGGGERRLVQARSLEGGSRFDCRMRDAKEAQVFSCERRGLSPDTLCGRLVVRVLASS